MDFRIPDAGGFFPFAINGDKSYVVYLSFNNVATTDFVPKWMFHLNKFPIYILIEIFEYEQEELELDCTNHKIEYEMVKNKKVKNIYYKAIIRNSEQFSTIFPYLYGNGSMNNTALWSLQKDVFSFGKRKCKTLFGKRNITTPIITLEEKKSVFWVGYDGDEIFVISNDKQFSSIRYISTNFPSETNIIRTEYEEG